MYRVLAALVCAIALLTPLAAQEAYPSRSVSVIVPFPPGGVADASARPVAAGLEKLLKQPFVVTNKPGAGGAVGMAQVANSKPDGYTLLLALSSISIIPAADALFDRPPAYRLEQLVPIALLSSDPTVLVVPADSPWQTVKDLVEDAKKRPGEIAYSSSGIYGTLHMAMEMFAHAADIKLRHVPFNGAGPALTNLLGGHVQLLASGPLVVLPHVKAGKLRVLAGWGDKRVEALPDVPTFKELGYKDVEFYIWAGLLAPAGTPEPVLKTLRQSVAKIVKEDEFKTAMANMQTPVDYKDAPEFKAFWDVDAQRLGEAVKRVGKVEDKK
jgi:tripartite-type tricarboxylate transporter receptor subunit TctC